jgi:hypothetical protein
VNLGSLRRMRKERLPRIVLAPVTCPAGTWTSMKVRKCCCTTTRFSSCSRPPGAGRTLSREPEGCSYAELTKILSDRRYAEHALRVSSGLKSEDVRQKRVRRDCASIGGPLVVSLQQALILQSAPAIFPFIAPAASVFGKRARMAGSLH